MSKSTKSAKELGVQLVEPAPDEVRFILDAWARSYRDSPWSGTITNDKYAEISRWTITSLVARGAKVLVAIPELGPRRVVGFVCYEKPDVLHYVYVKKNFRGNGVARLLVDAAKYAMGTETPGRFTHRTRASQWLLDDGWRFDPVSARTKEMT